MAYTTGGCGGGLYSKLVSRITIRTCLPRVQVNAFLIVKPTIISTRSQHGEDVSFG